MALEVPGSNPGRAFAGTLAQLGEHQDVSPTGCRRRRGPEDAGSGV